MLQCREMWTRSATAVPAALAVKRRPHTDNEWICKSLSTFSEVVEKTECIKSSYITLKV